VKVIGIMNRKGGVGKTTTVCNLAYWLASGHGKRVLVVDLDGQGNATDCLAGPEHCRAERGVGDAAPYKDTTLTLGAAYGMEFPDMPMGELARKSCVWPQLYVLPGGDGLFDLGDRLERVDALERFLHNEENKKQFDFVLIDCPPEFNIAVLNAIEASDRILIPTTDSGASKKGAACVIEELRGGDYDVRVTVLPVMWPGVRRRQKREAKDIEREITALGEELGCELAPTAISWTPKAGEADRADKLLALFSPKCAASMAYRWLARWLVEGR
jgi:chromosome partitioning protein